MPTTPHSGFQKLHKSVREDQESGGSLRQILFLM